MDYNSFSELNLKRRFSFTHLKIGVGIFAVIVIISIIFHTTAGRRANLLLSKNDIESLDIESEAEDFNANNKIFFFIGKKYGNLNASNVTIKIDSYSNSDYKNYKNINYEIEEDFKMLNSYIAGEYFKKPGKYRIRAFLDNNLISTRKIEVK